MQSKEINIIDVTFAGYIFVFMTVDQIREEIFFITLS